MAMYTNVKIDDHSIKLILDSSLADSIITKQFMDQLGYRIVYAVSTRIIMANRATKTSISKIDNLSFEVNMNTIQNRDTYSPKDTFNLTLQGALVGLGFGSIVAIVRNKAALDKVNSLARTRQSIAHVASITTVFTATTCVTANIRETDDWINKAFGGFVAGLIPGLRAQSFPLLIGGSVFLGICMGTYDYTGGVFGLLRGKTEEEKNAWRRRLVRTPPIEK
ncbi:hypothetical protein G9A89_001129 [Geosiphon pyriformis]|nr:hypothetical protein G9A89_001129 [Geosiphon pyriformis]